MAKGKKKDKKSKEELYKDKSIEEVLKTLQKQHGKESIRLMGDEKSIVKTDTISTGSLWVDNALGIGGLPRGRIVEIFGPEGSGKTTLALHCVAEAQKKGGKAAFIDAENALDIPFAKKIGVNLDTLLLSQPDCGEQGLEILESCVASGQVDIAVVDSVSALTPRAEITGEMGDSHMGLQARLMSQAMRKLTSITARTNTLVIFINQIRMKIGVMFGNPETTSGGNALKFYASVRLDIRRVGSLKEKDKVIGNKVKVKIVKNKLAPPFKVIETDLIFGEGFSIAAEILSMADDLEVVDHAGSRYYYNGELIANGRPKSIAVLKKDKVLLKSIYGDVRKARKKPNED